jgi:D-3-phosphoglycerate dehydrogenase / 2-oxoglutarate reductase
MGTELTGKTVGIVGLGYIGQLVARRLSGFEVRVLGYDPFTSEEKAEALGIELCTLPDLFARADVVTLHVPENDETRGMVNRSLLGLMKPGATLVNCARAGILDENDLRAAKAEKGLRFLNDVYPKDAEGPKSVADVADLMLPHLGASTREANRKAAELAARELIDLDDKGITSAVVNRDVPAGLDPAFGQLAHLLTRICRRVLGADTRLKAVETSFYGSLAPFAQWLLTPVATALSADYDPGLDHKSTLGFLADMGVDYENRATDQQKAYTNSITIDLIGHVDAEHLVRASVRGTVEEGNLLVARINDFDKLYVEPAGPWVVFSYDDRPGVLGRIAAALAAADVNIDDVRNPHDSKGKASLAILKVNRAVPDPLVRQIADDIRARIAFHVEL